MLREGLQLDPNDETALNVESYSLASDGDLQGALRDNDRYAALRPGDPNPVDTREWAGTTTISFDTGGGGIVGQVYVSINGGPEKTFATP